MSKEENERLATALTSRLVGMDGVASNAPLEPWVALWKETYARVLAEFIRQDAQERAEKPCT